MKRKGALSLIGAGFSTLKALAGRGRFWVAYAFVFGVYNVLAAQISASNPDGISDQFRMGAYVASNLSLIFTTLILLMLSKSDSASDDSVVWSEIWRVWKTNFVAGFYVIIGLVCFVVPGIVLAIRYLYINQVVVLEGEAITASLRRSRKLSTHNGGTLMVSYILILILYFALVIAAAAVVGLVSEAAVESFAFNYFAEVASTVMSAMFATTGYCAYLEALKAAENTGDHPVVS